uniref:Uncharacterized protein n=1 Tax=Alexandrium monilatum TaxID=311494 RepID=A0A7S4VMA6_9DINO
MGTAGAPPDRLVEVVLSVSLLALLSASVARRLWLEGPRLPGVAAGILRQWCPCFRRPQDPISQRIAEKCLEWRLERAQQLVMLVCCFLVALTAVQLVLTVQRSDAPQYSAVQMAAQYVVTAGFALLGLFPCVLTARTIDSAHSCYMLMVVVFVFGEGTEAGGESGFVITVNTAVVLGCVLNLNPGINSIWATSVAVALTFKAVTAGQGFLQFWVCATLQIVVVSWFDHALAAAVRLRILGLDSCNELAAVKTLLGTICDVVVELDSRRRLMQHCPRLANILLHGTGRSLQGASIEDFISSAADREDFARHLCGSYEGSAEADVFHARLCDSHGGAVAMELFSVAFEGPDARRRHLLGMREFTDIPPLQPLPELPPQPSSPRPERTPSHGTGAPVDRTETLSSGSSTSNSGGSEARGAPIETECAAKVLSLSSTLLTWSLRPQEGHCCPLHALLADSRSVAARMAAGPCRPAFRPADGAWQCRRCGIMDEEYRTQRKRQQCLLCTGIDLTPPPVAETPPSGGETLTTL